MMVNVANHLQSLDQNSCDVPVIAAAMAAAPAEQQKWQHMHKVAELQKVVWEQQRQHDAKNKGGIAAAAPMLQAEGFWEPEYCDEVVDGIACMQAKEVEVERRKMQVQGKVRAHLSRLESQGRQLEQLKRELECLEDPTRKEVAEVRRKIECVDRDLKPLKQLCDKKEKELKEAVKMFNEKNKLKNDLVAKLMEIVTSSERLRMQKLDELNKQLEAMEIFKHSV